MPAETILNANVPPTPTVAVTFAPVPPPPPCPTKNVIVLVVVASTLVCIPANGSLPPTPSDATPLVLDTSRG